MLDLTFGAIQAWNKKIMGNNERLTKEEERHKEEI
jgi:hypothetical protein